MHSLLFVFEFLGTTELLVVAIVALILFGPRKLPEIGRTLGRGIADFKRASDDFKRTWEYEVELERRVPAPEMSAATYDAAAEAASSGGANAIGTGGADAIGAGGADAQPEMWGTPIARNSGSSVFARISDDGRARDDERARDGGRAGDAPKSESDEEDELNAS